MEKVLAFKGDRFECFKLDWDTEFFGVNSARVIVNGTIPEKSQDDILRFCKEFEFVTISNFGNSSENNYWIGEKSKAFLTDVNIQFMKEVNEKPIYKDKNTKVFNNYSRNEKIINIAKTAFVYSRFFNDPLLKKELAKSVYVHWTKTAFDREDKYFVITERNNEIAGYILFSMDKQNDLVTIELLAVDEKFRGAKVGKSLIGGVEEFANKQGVKNIKVGTQANNDNAASFYAACGFRYKSCSSIFHCWNKK